MKRVLPTILTIVLAAGLWLGDPVRRGEPPLDPTSIDPGQQPGVVGMWQMAQAAVALPRAFPPHYAVSERVWVYETSARSDRKAFVRIIVAQDRRDLLAFEPTHAMRAGGWQPKSASVVEGLWHTRHVRSAQLLSETVILDTAFVLPRGWTAQYEIIEDTATLGPGWPGPGAIVQLIAPEGYETNALRRLVKSIADGLSRQLASPAP